MVRREELWAEVGSHRIFFVVDERSWKSPSTAQSQLLRL